MKKCTTVKRNETRTTEGVTALLKKHCHNTITITSPELALIRGVQVF